MIQIRPVSDLRNKFPEIEMLVNEEQPVYLTKNGYGAMVVLSLEEYAGLVDNVEMKRKYLYYQIYVRNYVVYYVVTGVVMEVRRFLYRAGDTDRYL